MMFPKRQMEKIHSWPLFILVIIALLILFFSTDLWGSLVIFIFSLSLVFMNGVTLKAFIRNGFYSLLFSFTFFILYLLYPAEELKAGASFQIGSVTFYNQVLIVGLKNVFRLFLLTSLSVTSLQGLSYTEIMLYLSSNRKVPVTMAYPILMALHSIHLLKNEFMRIKLSVRMRGLSKGREFFILFPLLVFAIRHAERGSLSLVTRGINPHKSYYFNYDVKKKDWTLFTVSFFFMLLVVAIGIFFQ